MIMCDDSLGNRHDVMRIREETVRRKSTGALDAVGNAA